MSETYCLKCSSTPCYISLLGTIECSNEKCEHFSRELYPDKTEQAKQDEGPQQPMFFTVSVPYPLW